jgi:translocator assembly and maintenance protein 41
VRSVAAQHIKYGVVDTGVFCRDLERWDELYCAGRLHKPVTHLLPLSARVAAGQARWSLA